MANLHVNLAFSADTGKAKAQIQELQTLLSKIAYTGTTSNNLTGTMQKDIQAASAAAKDLQFHLNNAFNTTTGKFDLSLLDRSLKTSGANITDLSTKLLGAGATGQQAFMKLAQSISLADQPMFRISNRMKEFAVTMKNTVKWQLSSSMLHGFMGAIQSAYGYAQDLNKSLTDIRIVTGYSTDQMAQFAEQANKAAKALSTTTTDYTNASLIYFQQGLSDAEVEERTNVTVKMANAAGQSAQIVSDQMTAVWNNFYDGSKSLEYYVDVMTALGAATASSTDEISQGLSKFAAVADTVGLSYEFATAALTTITSNTRESADVVGNALKTLFARIQGLQLGETLEDGTDLNKYSQALEKVGISIYEQNGELKEMDNILVEMANKWTTLSSTQQVALAQTVAGVRQYTQLIALMENWDNGDTDSMMANLRTIEGSEGALQKQADIYAQSWEAASKRVQAAAEGIYQSLLDDDFFISISNGFANLLGGIDAFIDGAGGVKGVLTTIASITLSTFAHQIPSALDTFRYNLQVLTKGSQEAYKTIQNQMKEATQTAFNEYLTSGGTKGIKEDSSIGYAVQQANELTAARSKLALVSDKMSASEKQLADMSLSHIQQRQDEVIALKQKNEVLKESIELQKQELLKADIGDKVASKASKQLLDDTVVDLQAQQSYYQQISQRSGKKQQSYQAEASAYSNALSEIRTFAEQFDAAKESIRFKYDELHQIMFKAFESGATAGQKITSQQLFGDLDFTNPKNAIDGMVQSIEKLRTSATKTNSGHILEAMRDEVSALSSTIPEAVQKATGLKQIFDKIASKSSVQTLDQMDAEIENLKKGLKEATIDGEKFESILKGFHGSKITNLTQAMETLKSQTADVTAKAEALQQLLNNFNPGHIVRLSEAFSGLAGFLGSTVMAVNSIKSAFTALGNPDLSGWEKFSSVIMGITMALPSAKAAFNGLSTAIQGGTQWIATQNLLLGASTGAFGANTAAIGAKTMAEIANYIATAKSTGELEENIVASVAAKLMTKGLAQADAEAAAAAMVHAGGVEFLNGALTKLGALLTWIKGHLLLAVGIAAAVVAAIAGIVWIIDQLHTSQKEANEAISEANDKYTEEKQKLDELNNSLKTTQDRIAELQSQDSLSLVEQEELDKLLEQEASLQRQVALQEQLTQVAKQNSATTFENNAEKASSWMDTAPTSEKWTTVYDPSQEMYVDKYYDSIEDFKADIDRMYLDANGQVIAGQEALYQEYMAQYDAWVNEYNQAQAQWIEANKDSLLELTEGYQNWFDLYGNNPQYAEQMMQYAKLISDANKAIYGDSYDTKVLGSMDNTFEASTDANDKNVANTIIKDLSDGTGAVEASAADIAAGFSDSFKNSLLKQGILPEDYAQHLIDEYSRIASALKDTGITLEDLIAGGMSLEDLEILAQIKITGEDDLNSILEKIEAYKSNNIEVGFNLGTWKSNYNKKMEIAEGLEPGDIISAADYALLGDNYKQYFQLQEDGTAILIAKAGELKEAVNTIETLALKEDIYAKRDTIAQMSNTSLTAFEGSAMESYMNFDTAHAQATEGRLATEFQLPYIEAVNEALGTQYTTLAEANAAYNNYVNSLASSQAVLASTADEIGELDSLFFNGDIGAQDYINQLQVLAAQYENCRDELAAYQKALEDGDDEAAAAADDALHGAIRAAELAEEYDLSAEAIERYADELKDSGKYTKANSKALVEMAKDQLRFDRAVESAAEHMDDWKDALKTAAKTGHLAQDTAEEMADAYGDLLDIDGDLLPSSFLKDVENLELMEKALNGDEEAYDSLLAKSRQAIAAKVGLDDAEFQSKFNNLLNQYYQAQSLDDIEVGASLDNAGFLQALTDMVNAAGMTADQATSYLASMGVDADVVTEPITETDPVTYVNATPQISWSGGMGTHPATGFPTMYRFPSVGYSLTPTTLDSTKQTTGMALRVTSASKSSGGGIKHSGSNAASGGGSKGGGGGGSKQPPKHAEKKNDSDKERYHTITNQLEDLANEYDKISDAADRAFGKDKLNAIDAEIRKTDELIDKQEEYIAAISADLPKDRAIMSEYYNDLIGGNIQFDEKGNISNFDQIQDAMYAKYNAMADAYSEDSEEWQVFEKKFEQLEKYIEQYEETYDLLREQETEYQDLLNQRIDLMLEKVTYKVELQLDIEDDELQVLDYLLGRIEDDAFEAAETIGILTQQAETLYDKMQINKQGLEEVLGLSLSTSEIISIMNGDLTVLQGKTFTEEQIESIKDYRDNLLELNEEFDEVREQVEEQVIEVFDAWNEKLGEGIDQLEHYGDVLESYRNIIDIVGEDGLGISEEFIKNLNEAQIGNAIDKVNATRDAYEAMMKAQQEAEKALEEAKERGDEASVKMWTENLAELTDEANSAQEEFLSAWEDALDTVAEQFEMTVERVVESFNESIYALGGLEGLSEEFARQQETADMMVDDYQKIYELSKLNRDIQRTLDDTDVIAGKQKLLKLQEKINDLEAEGVEMSQYDLEYLQAEYELRMAEIELENAQKAKDTVRMSRDNEGNWSYVYTTNTDAVDEAQQKYEDALYAMQDLSSNYIDEMSEKLISTSQEMEEALASLRIQDFASIDDYYAEVERIKKEYGEQLALEQAELQKAIDNNKVLYDEDMTNYAKATGEKYRLAEEFVTSFKDSLLGSIMDSESESANFTDIIGSAVDDLTTGLMEAATTYYQNLEAAMNAADTSTGDFAEDTAANIDAVVEKSKEGAEAIDQMAIEMTEAFQEITDMVTNWQETYGMAMEKIIQSNLDVIESFNNMLEALSIDADKINVSYDINTSPEKDNPAAFDTGGYTGKWGDIGKLAVLHEKELILNENDTSNFLKAINISKVILDMIETNAKYASMGLGQITPTVIKEEAKETLEQIVHITADFSGVKDRNEIEEAFKSLINTSSQYANRK